MTQIELVDIETLVPDPANVRKHTRRNIEAVKASLMRFRQQSPLIVDTNNIVRVGNCRLLAMRELNWSRVGIIRTDLTGSEAIAFSVADNRSGDAEVGSTFDHNALVGLLEELGREDASLVDAAGWTAEELMDYYDRHRPGDPEPQLPPSEFPAFDETLPTDHECPRCKFKWSGSTRPAEAA